MHLNRKRFYSALLASALALALPFQSYAAEKLSRVSPGVYRLFEDGDTISGVLRRRLSLAGACRLEDRQSERCGFRHARHPLPEQYRSLVPAECG